ncbi:MAG: glycosylase [Bacteroidales bacterium]|nr:glycosylase [Bacteroidales bacterium]
MISACHKPLPEMVPDNVMKQVYHEIKTPYKYGLIMVPDSNSYKIDCPTIFRKNNQWFMTYIVFDGRGYETWLAESNNLIDWDIKGKILQFSDSTEWDMNQKAGYPSLISYKWGGYYSINSWNGKYWMSYFGGNSRGYERGVLSIGIAYTEKDPTTAHKWQRIEKPVIMPNDSDARWYDNSTLYKSSVIRDEKKLTGFPFVMFYNARGDSVNPAKGAERISMAVSNDMVHWKRFGTEPVINHHKGISGDAVIQKIGKVYVMFYFGAFWPDQNAAAFNRFACSYDLVHWTDWTGPNLIEPTEEYDRLFAHKSCIIKHKGIIYHFYNAVDKKGNRGIALATSKQIGTSNIKFK